MKLIREYGIFLLLITSSLCAFPQWENGQMPVYISLPVVAMVDIEPGFDNRIHFTLVPHAESGNQPGIAEHANETLWINYSSALPAGQNSRSITAEISQGFVPSGFRIYLEAAAYTGNGDGQHGSPAGRIELSDQPISVITGIGNGFTGNGAGKGHSLAFSLEISDYSMLSASEESNFVVLYTLTDN
jgi:hypothetical protein